MPADLAPIVLADDIEIPDDVIELMPESMARENVVIPVADTVDALVVAVTKLNDIETVDKLRFVLNRNIRIVHVAEEWLRAQLHKHYRDETDDRLPI